MLRNAHCTLTRSGGGLNPFVSCLVEDLLRSGGLVDHLHVRYRQFNSSHTKYIKISDFKYIYLKINHTSLPVCGMLTVMPLNRNSVFLLDLAVYSQRAAYARSGLGGGAQ